jgi:hypothetical protein
MKRGLEGVAFYHLKSKWLRTLKHLTAAYGQLEKSQFCSASAALCRHRLPLVHWRAAGPNGGIRRLLLFHCVLRSGLLFLAMLFASSAVAGGIMMVYGAMPGKLMDSGMYIFGRTVSYQIINVYAVKMAGVFMMYACTLSVPIGIFPRWMAFLGYALALLLLLGFGCVTWLPPVFPLWVLLMSGYLLHADQN